jgi:serine/threonine protein kinase
MDDTRKKLTGQTADAKYPLLEYLGGSRHSSVFRTEIAASPSAIAPSSTGTAAAPTKAAIKIIPAAGGSAEPQLNRWRQAERLSHPNLVKIYASGECRLGNEDFLYVVEEFADEDLSQILPQRALTAEETRGMLAATLDALFYLHAKGFVHGHLSPANIMAIGDEIKLSSDGIVRAGERLSDSGRLSPYDPPEAASGRISTAADMWSLGMTLAEVLTQKLPIWERLGREEPRLPESMPQPFADIARRCLQRDPKSRWTVEQVASALSHTLLQHVEPPLKARAAVASVASIAAAAASAPSECAPVGESRRASRASESVAKPASVAAPATALPRERPAGTNLAVAVGAIALLVLAILEAPRLLKHDPHAHAASANSAASSSEPASDAASSNSAAPPASTSPTPAPATSDNAATPPAPSPSRSVAKPSAEKSAPSTRPSEKIVKSAAPPKPASAAPPNPASTAASSSASPESASAAITHREIPNVPQRSLATITGTVRVAVRVNVAADGSVSDASFDHEGPSAYFSRISMNAARAWKFSPSAPRAWVLHFQFTSSGAKAEATPAAN